MRTPGSHLAHAVTLPTCAHVSRLTPAGTGSPLGSSSAGRPSRHRSSNCGTPSHQNMRLPLLTRSCYVQVHHGSYSPSRVAPPHFWSRHSLVHTFRPTRNRSTLRTPERVAVQLRRQGPEEARPASQGKILITRGSEHGIGMTVEWAQIPRKWTHVVARLRGRGEEQPALLEALSSQLPQMVLDPGHCVACSDSRSGETTVRHPLSLLSHCDSRIAETLTIIFFRGRGEPCPFTLLVLVLLNPILA